MVLQHAVCAVNLASAVLANGMCCFYEMKKEEESKQVQEAMIRQSIHSEWERQRFLDMIERQQERDALQQQEKRRIYLMQAKQSFDPATESTKHPWNRRHDLHYYDSSHSQIQSIGQRNRLIGTSGAFARISSTRPNNPEFTKLNSSLYEREHRPTLPVYTGLVDDSDEYQLRNLSSLMDDFEDEESDNEFEEICIE